MPPAKGKTKVIDRGWVQRNLNLRALDGWRATAGVHGTEDERGDDFGPDNVQLAVWHEFGTEDVPERSFLRSAFDANRIKYEKLLQLKAGLAIDGVIKGKQAVGFVGERMVADIVNGINRGIPPPNAESTIEAKGSSKPLIDTGQLKGSVTYKVHK